MRFFVLLSASLFAVSPGAVAQTPLNALQVLEASESSFSVEAAAAASTIQHSNAILTTSVAASQTSTLQTATTGSAVSLHSESASIHSLATIATPTAVITSSTKEPRPSASVNTDAGAAGTSVGTMGLSQAGVVAIIIVVICVVILGVVSTVFYYIAKRREWNIRSSIVRVSRRLTGRAEPPVDEPLKSRFSNDKGYKRMGSKRPGVRAVYPPGHSRALVINVEDIEKGNLIDRPDRRKAPGWPGRLWQNGWR